MTFGFNGYYGGGGRSGYDYRDTSIIGFAHVHEWQTGGILLMPTTGPLTTVPGDATNASGFRSPFQKANEKASAGYYSVLLDKYSILAELTATIRVGFHKYIAFRRRTTLTLSSMRGICWAKPAAMAGAARKAGKFKGLALKSCPLRNYKATPSRCRAYQTYRPDLEKKSIRVYFAAVVSKPALSYGCYRDNTHNDGLRAEYGQGCGAYLNF